MNILFVVLILMFAWHFVVQAIFIPNHAHDSKYKLYALRDKLRRLYIKGSVNQSEFIILDEFTSNAIKYYRNVTLYDILGIKKSSSEVDKKTGEQMKSLLNCEKNEYVQIRDEVFSLSFKNAFHNSLGWLPYLIVPTIMIFVYLVVSRQFTQKKADLKKRSSIVVLEGDYIYC